MMKPEDVVFDEDFEMQIFIPELNRNIRLVISDDLFASEEELTEEYKSRIAAFINSISRWHPEAVNGVLQWARQIYALEAEEKDVRLLSIFILFEQNEDELFGLEFSVEFDREHGCGLKITGKNFEIVEVGTGDVAFC
jgi:hypothetical protein